jgi:hypothetical protein
MDRQSPTDATNTGWQLTCAPDSTGPGPLSMYAVNRPPGQKSMLLVAAVPMAEVPQMAARQDVM